MQRQQKLPLGDANALRALWTHFTDDQRTQVIAILAELLARAAYEEKEQRHDAIGK